MTNKIKFSEFLIKLLEKLELTICFGVTGGYSMHLNNFFGKSKKIKSIYNHHEQASIFSAIGYAKYTNKIPVVCVTAGCGVTNTITGIMDCWQDSVPCLIISGQTNSQKTINYNKSKGIYFRHYSGQDVDITEMVKDITKYSMEFNLEHTIDDIKDILIKVFSELFLPRSGPVLLSVPLDIQNLLINNYDDYINLITEAVQNNIIDFKNQSICSNEKYDNFISLIKESKNPLILAGGGIKSSLSKNKFFEFISKYNIPVVSTYSGIDIFESNSDLYQGRIGIYGERCGNYTVQKCDLLIIFGSRVSETTIGYNENLFNSCKKIIVNIDDEILKINKINCDLFIKCDLLNFFTNLPIINDYQSNIEWLDNCKDLKKKYFFDKPLLETTNTKIKPYDFFEKFSELMPENAIITPAAGSIFYILRHMIKIKKNTNIIINSQQDLGYELPSAVGSYFGSLEKEEDKFMDYFCFNGDGSIQFNIQELQTIKHHNIPLKVIVFNNNKYGCIEVTQKNYFGSENIYGIDEHSGLSFPSFKKLALAYDIDYLYLDSNNIEVDIYKLFDRIEKPMIIEINAEYQDRYPKLGIYTDESGLIKPTPFDKMNPQI